MAGELGVLSSVLVQQFILPIILVFTVIFAVLQKSKVLGDGKRQIDSIVALVMALILVGFANARGIIVDLVTVMSVVLIVTLVFMILYGFVGGTTDKGFLNKPLQIVIGIVGLAAIVITLLISTGVLPLLKDYFLLPGPSQVGQTIIVLLVVAIVFVIAVTTGKSEK